MAENLEELNAVCEGCQKCRLGATRTNLVFGVGVENAEVMFIGEGPGENEDLQGEPFVGRGGKLLDDRRTVEVRRSSAPYDIPLRL